jgi:dTDP-4-amino-4,6-dideoxygalactose transaminase
LIPFLDLGAALGEVKAEILLAIENVVSSNQFILGDEVEKFEDAFAQYCGVAHCVGVGNGLSALQLGLLAMGVQPGDEVIVPSNTFIATWLAVDQCGAIPVPVEPDERTYNIDPAKIEAAITARTRAIIPVHLYGQPADLDPILEIAKVHGLGVLEDGAQAHGATYKGRRLGGHGKAVAWSFYPGKNLGAMGDAGAVTTNDAGIAARLRALRNYGSSLKYVHEIQGFNSRLDPIQAAVLSVKLSHLDRWNAQRREIATTYIEALEDCSVVLPYVPPYAEPVWHLFVVTCKEREFLQGRLQASGIATLIHYPIPPHLQGAYASRGWTRGSFPISENLHDCVLSLPIYPGMSPKQVDGVIAAMRTAARK